MNGLDRMALVMLARAERTTVETFGSGHSRVNGGDGLYLMSPQGLHLWDQKTGQTTTVKWDQVAEADAETGVIRTLDGDDILVHKPHRRFAEFLPSAAPQSREAPASA